MAIKTLVKIKRLNQSTRDKAIKLIHSLVPEIWSDIQEFSKEHKLNEGDVAVKVVADVIHPALTNLGGRG